MNKLAKLRRLSWRDWGLLLEIGVLLGLARLAILLVPFRHIARIFGPQHAETPAVADLASEPRVRHLGTMIRATARNLPWECKCLAQAMAGKVMLARRGLPSTVYFGVRNDDEGEFGAHAWLRSGAVYVTGGPGHRHFTVLTIFADG